MVVLPCAPLGTHSLLKPHRYYLSNERAYRAGECHGGVNEQAHRVHLRVPVTDEREDSRRVGITPIAMGGAGGLL